MSDPRLKNFQRMVSSQSKYWTLLLSEPGKVALLRIPPLKPLEKDLLLEIKLQWDGTLEQLIDQIYNAYQSFDRNMILEQWIQTLPTVDKNEIERSVKYCHTRILMIYQLCSQFLKSFNYTQNNCSLINHNKTDLLFDESEEEPIGRKLNETWRLSEE